MRPTAGHIVALKWSMENIFSCPEQAMFIGRHLMWVGWLVILTLFMHLYLQVAQRFCLKANRLAHQMRLRFGG